MKKKITISFFRLNIFILCMIFCLACSSGKVQSEEKRSISKDAIGYIEYEDLEEASGLAYSTRNAGIIWSHNDSGNDPIIYSMSESGRGLGRFMLEDSASLDWEDMASFRRNETSYLMVADTGDNFEIRGYYSLNIVPEPEIDAKAEKKGTKSLKTEKIIKFTYPDGSHDSEASAYDPGSDSFLVVTKRTSFPVLYEVPFSPETNDVITAKKICDLNLNPGPAEDDMKNKVPQKALKVTGMDISRDGLSMVILTYADAFIYKKKSIKDTWKNSVSSQPKRIRLFHHLDKRLVQREAVCFSPDAKSILVTTEKRPAGIFRFMVK